ncbi:MAG: hypothetical protein M1839_007538 [Geoglossum umbratile]|nr:MAG: hypothetical protein M1839_007538 [Geoglossum umbratile]
MDHTTVQPSEFTIAVATAQRQRPLQAKSSALRPVLSQQPTSCQQSVHAIVHRPPSGSGRDSIPRSPHGGSSKYTNSSVGSTLSPGSPSSGGSPYLTPPVVGGDEPPPFKPDKEDHASLCMYEGPHSHEARRRSRNRVGYLSPTPAAASPRKRSGRTHRIPGLIEPLQYDERMRLAEAKHDKAQESMDCALISRTFPVSSPSPHRFQALPQTEHIGQGPRSATPSPTSPLSSPPTSIVIRNDYVNRSSATATSLQPPPLSSPRLSTLIRDDYVDRGLAAVTSPGPPPVQGILPAGQRGRGDVPLRGAAFDRRWSVDVGIAPAPAFLRSLDTFYGRANPTSKEIRESKIERGNEDHRKRKAKLNGHKSVPDTPATITLRRASTVAGSGKMSADDAYRMSRQRQDDLQGSMSTFFGGEGKVYSNQSSATSCGEGAEEAPSKRPNFGLSPRGIPALGVIGDFNHRPGFNDLAPQRHASGSPEPHLLADRSGFADPVTTYTTSRQANGLIAGRHNAPDNGMRRPSTTIQNVKSSSSIYEVIWKDDYTPSDFRAERRDTIGGTPTTDDQTDSSGSSSRSGVSSDSLDGGFKPGGVAGWSWTGNSRRDSVGTRVQFRFEPKGSSALHHTNESSTGLVTSGDPMAFMESFPSLPERRSTLEWRTPSTDETGDTSDAKIGEYAVHNHAPPETVEAEQVLDPHPGCKDARMALPAPDPPDPIHSSARG